MGKKGVNGWISVSDNLPVNEQVVLWYTKQGMMYSGMISPARNLYPHLEYATHWMPLPDIPVNQQDEGVSDGD